MLGLLGAMTPVRYVALQVRLAVIRLQGANGDIMVTLSTPIAGPAASAPPALERGESKDAPYGQAQLFEAMCKTLRFHDRSLLT